jgi:hypothetical protein
VCAAANALAVGIEQDDFDPGHPVTRQRLADLQSQPLYQVSGGQLPDVASGIGIAKLQRELAGLLQVVPVMRAAQRLFQHRGASLQSVRGFEQRGDFDVTLNPEQPGEP